MLALDDAVGSKVQALYSRAYPRDYLDVAAILASGRYSSTEILTLADERSAEPLDRAILVTQLARITAMDAEEFSPYADQEAIRQTRAGILNWARTVDVQREALSREVLRAIEQPDPPDQSGRTL